MHHDIKAIRLANLKILLRRYPTNKDFALAADMSPSHLSQLGVYLAEGEPVRKIGNRLARKIEENLGLPVGCLDHEGSLPESEQLVPIKEASIELLKHITEGFGELEMKELMMQANIIRRRKAASLGLGNGMLEVGQDIGFGETIEK